MLDTLVVVGVNHDSAPVTLRERIAFAPEKVHESLGALIRDTQLSEAVILSTCNRTELYGVLPTDADGMAASDELSRWLAAHHDIDINQLSPCVYRSHGSPRRRIWCSGGRTQLHGAGGAADFWSDEVAFAVAQRREQWVSI